MSTPATTSSMKVNRNVTDSDSGAQKEQSREDEGFQDETEDKPVAMKKLDVAPSAPPSMNCSAIPISEFCCIYMRDSRGIIFNEYGRSLFYENSGERIKKCINSYSAGRAGLQGDPDAAKRNLRPSRRHAGCLTPKFGLLLLHSITFRSPYRSKYSIFGNNDYLIICIFSLSYQISQYHINLLACI